MKRSPVVRSKRYAATVHACFLMLACLALEACVSTKKISDYDKTVTNVTVVYVTARDRNSYAGPYRTQRDNDRFLEIKKFSEFTSLFGNAIVNEFARVNCFASFQVVDVIPQSMSEFNTPHVLSLTVKEVQLTFADISGYITYEVTLDDVALGKPVWQHDESTGAGALSTFDKDKAESLARHIVDHLKSDKLLPGK